MQRTCDGLTMTGFPVASSVNLWNSMRMVTLHEGGARVRHWQTMCYVPQARAPSPPRRLAPRFISHRRVQDVFGRGAAPITEPRTPGSRLADNSTLLLEFGFVYLAAREPLFKDFHGSRSGLARRLICASLPVTT